MAEDFDQVFGDAETVEAPEAVEPQPVETPEPEALEQPEPEPAPEPAPEPPVEAPKDERVPLATYLDTRDRAKKAEARAAELEARFAQQPAPPSPYDDPEGYAAYQEQRVQALIVQDRFERSNEAAIEKYGEDTVQAAVEWATTKAQQNPSFAADYMRSTRPIEWIVQQHKRDGLLGQIGDRGVDEFVRDYIAKNPELLTPAPVAAAPEISVAAQPKPAVPPVRVPRSLATQGSGPSDVRDVATGPLAAVDTVFPN
jgi:hypothetical protein